MFGCGLSTLGIRNYELGIKISPNPVNSLLVVSFSLLEKNSLNISLYDIMGREVATIVEGVKEMGTYILKYNAEGLKSGVYFVKIMSDYGVGVTKFVKQF